MTQAAAQRGGECVYLSLSCGRSNSLCWMRGHRSNAMDSGQLAMSVAPRTKRVPTRWINDRPLESQRRR